MKTIKIEVGTISKGFGIKEYIEKKDIIKLIDEIAVDMGHDEVVRVEELKQRIEGK